MLGEALILNAGSSSLKFSIFVDEDDTPEVYGLIDRIGAGKAGILLKDSEGRTLPTDEVGSIANHAEALSVAASAMAVHYPDHRVSAVGHRVVHGGTQFSSPVLIDDAVEAQLARLVPLAPLHQPHCVAGIRAARQAFPEAMQLACFDTAFHRSMPRLNEIYAIPRRYYDSGIRRYGFHGLSYDYIAQALRARDPGLIAGRVIVAHLGNGASLCAMRDGRSVATTMGFSALDGLAMGTRCGQIDPGALLYLLDHGMSSAELSQLLYRESGLRGLSGISGDMRVLMADPSPDAQEAVAYFVQSIRRGIGEMTALLGGLDRLVFTAGIGENSPEIRAGICSYLDWMGLRLDGQANDENAFRISGPESAVAVLVIPTREDLTILNALRTAASG